MIYYEVERETKSINLKESDKMKVFIKLTMSLLCLGLIIACTIISFYEVYNSYLAEDPKNIVTYHQAAVNNDSRYRQLPDKATEDDADMVVIINDAVATPEEATSVFSPAEELLPESIPVAR